MRLWMSLSEVGAASDGIDAWLFLTSFEHARNSEYRALIAWNTNGHQHTTATLLALSPGQKDFRS